MLLPMDFGLGLLEASDYGRLVERLWRFISKCLNFGLGL